MNVVLIQTKSLKVKNRYPTEYIEKSREVFNFHSFATERIKGVFNVTDFKHSVISITIPLSGIGFPTAEVILKAVRQIFASHESRMKRKICLGTK